MLAPAASARAASVQLHAGPLTQDPTQVAWLALSNTGGFACRASLAFLSGPVGEDGAVALARHPVTAGDGLRGGVGAGGPVTLTLEIAAGRTSAAAVAVVGR